MGDWMARHPDGIALTLAAVAGFLFCLGVIWLGTHG